MPLDPQTAMVLARMLQGQIGSTPSPDLLGSFYQSNVPGTSLDDALSSAQQYLSTQGQGSQAPAAPPGPQVTGFETPGAGPGQIAGGGSPGPGATGFGAPASIGQAMAQAQSGPISAGLGPLGSSLFGSLMSTALSGSLLGGNPLVGLGLAGLNLGGKFGARGATGEGLEGMTIGDLNDARNFDPEVMNALSQTVDFTAPSTLAAQSISSAQGRGPSFGLGSIDASGGFGQGAAGGGGLTGVSGVPGDLGSLNASTPTARSGLDVTDAPPDAPGPGPSAPGPGPDGGPGVGSAAGGGSGEAAGMRRGGYVPGTGSGDTVPVRLEPGEFVVTKQAAKGRGGALSRLNKEKGLRAPIESLDDLLTRARAHFDVSGTAGPGLPTMRGPR